MQKRHGFTLVELLVVIAIIGILAGILAPKLLRAMDSAKEQNCRNNLKQLQTAVIHFAADRGGALPFASNFEIPSMGSLDYPGGDGFHPRGDLAWVMWIHQSGDIIDPRTINNGGSSFSEEQYGDDLGIGEPSLIAIRRGALYSYVGDERCYYCPVTERNRKLFMDEGVADSVQVHRTYAMNGYFRGALNRDWAGNGRNLNNMGMPGPLTLCDSSKNFNNPDGGNPNGWDEFKNLPQPDRLLLFSEVLPSPSGKEVNQRKGGGDVNPPMSPYDGDLSPKNINSVSLFTKPIPWPGLGEINMGFAKSEMICALHEPLVRYVKSGNPIYVASALAVFLDGHIEKVSPVVATSTDDLGNSVADTDANAAWFYVHGLRPATKMPGK
jgi:prepilin-type N-terminal cleavage/methylation domain-containing protein